MIYNMKKGSHHSPEAKEKLRLSRLGKKHTPEALKKIGLWSLGKKKSLESNEKNRVSHLGKKRSAETLEKMRNVARKENLSPETLEKMRISHTNKKHTLETKEILRISNTGRKHTAETIEKIRFSHLRENQSSETLEKRSVAARSRLTNGWRYESPVHRLTKEAIGARLTTLGYDVSLERFVRFDNINYAVDVYAKKNNDVIIFEVGQCTRKKIVILQSHYPIVLQVPKGKKFLH